MDKGQDPEMQLSELREYAGRRGLDIFAEFVDRCSGSRESRPELDRMLAAARCRNFDALLVLRIDRLGRSLRHLVVTLAELDSLGVAFISLRDNLDLSTPPGRLMFHVISAMAQFERELTVERVRAGLRNARAKGKRLGRPSRSVDSTRIIELREQGMSWREIGKTLKVGTGTAYRAAAKAAAPSPLRGLSSPPWPPALAVFAASLPPCAGLQPRQS